MAISRIDFAQLSKTHISDYTCMLKKCAPLRSIKETTFHYSEKWLTSLRPKIESESMDENM